MKLQRALHMLALASLLYGHAAQAQEEFGRLYTTPGQRGHLDELRSRQPRGEVAVELENDVVNTAAGDEPPPLIDSIMVNGLVHRSDGKNTAWINRNSTNEGGIETQYTRVDESDVRPDRVRIILPDNRTSVELKVGQEYDVHNRRVLDVIEDASGAGRTGVPGGGPGSR